MLLQIKNISKSYAHRVILDEINLEVGKGESIAIIGPSGSGKTTLLNLIAGLDIPDKGEICIDGKNLFTMNPDEMAMFRNRHLGLIFQLHHLLPQLSLYENILLPSLTHKALQGTQTEERAQQLIARTGLQQVVKQKPGELSGGECQRTAVARALINQPEILLADEPTGALDAQTAERLADLLVELNRENATALITVTHSMALAEKMDKIYRLENGKLIQQTSNSI